MKTAIKKAVTEYDRALVIGAHFGFTPIDAPRVTPKDIEAAKDSDDDDVLSDSYISAESVGRRLFDAAEKAAFLRMYQERGFASLPHPLALAFKRADARRRDYTFELVGFSTGCAEALLVRTALSVLTEEGHRSLVIDLNSMGDKDSIQAYERELHNYARKIGDELESDLRKRIRKNVYELMKVARESEALRDKMPQSIGSLSAASRAHFKEVLEHIESLGAEFRLLPTLLGNRNFCSETLFAVRDGDTNQLLALGFRYPRLSKKLGFKKEIPLTGMTVFCEAKKETRTYKDLPRPKFYLVQLGREARMKAVPLIELLRSHKIAVHHGLGKDKIVPQLEHADRTRAPYLLIMGQKEALENSVTVRNVTTRAQDTIHISRLPDYLKNLPF